MTLILLMPVDFPTVKKNKKSLRKPQQVLSGRGEAEAMRLHFTTKQMRRELAKGANEWGVSKEGAVLEPQIQTPQTWVLLV